MTSRVYAATIATHLTDAGHTSSETGPAWAPGFRVAQASPYTTRIHHDGPDEQQHLDAYADALRALGYVVTAEHPDGRRPRIRATHR
ncbi:hypothetical protein ACF09L_32755 [Streptomyces sp. NPDC014779]|uniref:hypothetical protein n=1 Tax=Streptomyces sp. NPDC014779 TaxID=3364911 RepID=UPI0036F6A8E3